MKKSLKILITIFFVLIALWGIIFFIDYLKFGDSKEPISGIIEDNFNEKNQKTEEQYEFIATIIGVYEKAILVEPEEGTNERKSSDKISMGIIRPTNGTNDFYVVGNKVKITYNGIIMESYPAQIVATKIELVK